MTIAGFYSDPHFGHRRIIEFARRPFRDLDEMQSVFIDRYNAKIGAGDTVIWCGDAFFMEIAEAKKILSAMNGSKLLVRGNHDGTKPKMASIGFDIVVDELELRIGGRHALVSHYPYDNSKRLHSGPEDPYEDRYPVRVKGRALIHGHDHSPSKGHSLSAHVGVDAWDYGPAMWGEVEAVLRGGKLT
ncbi:MAG: hypothetical protein DRH30_10450 [Deltaproteobacteria bacterium]|nr:MAG: hypothetical protein DRH30_10450 [Deltaproteobacteria bacterium]